MPAIATRRSKPSPQLSPGHTGRGSKIVAALLLLAAAFARAATPAEVDASVARGKLFIYAQQQPDGTWETDPPPPPGPLKKAPDDTAATVDTNQYGNRTALAVYALLEAGESPTEPKLQKAIAFLRTATLPSTYVLSLKCLVWSSLPVTNEVKQSIRRDAAALLALKKMSTAKFLVWDYTAFAPPRSSYSLTNTQNAAWGLWAAGEIDYEVPPDVWKQIERTFAAGQLPDGGWINTVPGKGPVKNTPTMFNTALGLSAIYLAQDYTRADAFAVPRGNATDTTIEKGLDWITKNYVPTVNDAKTPGYENPHRRLHGIEQVALASGLRRFGEHDWYADGSFYLVKYQNKKENYWGYTPKPGSGDYRLLDTCWAVIYLQRGRIPLAMAKLNYTAGSDDPKKALWNQRPRDAANVTDWIARSTEHELRWQVVEINDTPAALLEAPVLYVAGGEALALKPDAKDKLRDYVNHGGLIFAAADGGAAPFAKSVEKLGQELFPGNEWRDLPDTHPVFATQAFRRSAFKGKPAVRALGNGIRECMILLPTGDPAKTWQLRSGRANPDAWQIAANVLSYAVDKSHYFPRGSTWLVPAGTLTAKHTVTVGRLKYAGKWDPEPAAWEQLNNYGVARDWAVKTTPVEAGEEIKGINVLYVSGTNAFTFDDATRTAVKNYLDGGGRVFFEAAGGSAAFAASAQTELTRWYGADALVPLPPTHKIYGDAIKVGYRTFGLGGIDRPTEPRLLGVEKDGRVQAILSREDLTAGLLGVPTDGITGYTPEAARLLLLRVLTRWK